MSENQKDKHISFSPEIQENILLIHQLHIESEDPILDFVNHLYDPKKNE